MSKFRDIDAFFNGQKPFEEKITPVQTPRARLLRFLKMAMPSLAAVLVALILLYPTLKKNTVVADFDMTLPRQGELEKLHIEQTEFTVTDKENKVSTFTADRIDETEPGSKLMKIINPKGQIPTGQTGKEESFVHIDSDIGYYNQQANTVRTEQNVKAVYEDGTTVLTEEADYDFNTQLGKGAQDIYAFGDWGELWAEGFEYRQRESLLILFGKSKVKGSGRIVEADQELRYYQAQNKLEAEGNVRVFENENILYADRVIAYFKDSALSEIDKTEAFGHVLLLSPKGTAQGDYAVYLPSRSEIEMTGNVKIVRDGNEIYGPKAVTNLETSVSRIVSEKQGGRVSGVIRGATVKGEKHEKK